MVGMDHAPLQFDLRGQLIGAGGANLHYIRNETGAIATLRGRGSMFIDLALGAESPEPMHLYIEHPRFDGLQSAKQLAKNLIETLQQELVLYHQLHPPAAQAGPPMYNTTPAMGNQTSQPIPTQMSVPPPIMAVPPPPVMAQQPTSMLDASQNYITQSAASIVANPQIPPPSQPPNIMQQHTMIPHTVPLHLHPGNMIIQQQQLAPAPVVSNVNIPPPAIKPSTVMQFQAPPPNQIQLSQPPPNIQLHQSQTPNTQQIILNPPPQNYQYQYIQQSALQSQPDGTTAAVHPNQMTIQHIYQPQQHIQGMVQSSQAQAHFNPFVQPGQVQRQVQQLQPGQQYFVQGNNAFLVPPPNILQPPQQSFIFQTQPPPNHIQMQPIQSMLQPQSNPTVVESDSNTTNDDVKEESSDSPEHRSSPNDQTDDSKKAGEEEIPKNVESDESSVVQQQIEATAQLMNVPPPMTCVQHIVGNTLITTTQPGQLDSQKIYSQIPMSIQQAPQQQIHVSTPNGQHFLVHAQQWAQQSTQFQQVSQAGFHLSAPQSMAASNDAQRNVQQQQGHHQQQQILTTTFNPNHLQTSAGMQVQFQQLHPTQQQHFIQQFPAVSMAQLIEQPPPDLHANQLHLHTMPPTFTVATIQQPATQLIDSIVNHPRLGGPPTGAHSVPHPISKTNVSNATKIQN